MFPIDPDYQGKLSIVWHMLVKYWRKSARYYRIINPLQKRMIQHNSCSLQVPAVPPKLLIFVFVSGDIETGLTFRFACDPTNSDYDTSFEIAARSRFTT